MITVGSVVVGARDVARAAEFHSRALGYLDRGGADETWVSARPTNGSGPNVSIMYSRSPAEERPRVHVDFYAADACEQAAEVERLVGLGASHVDWSDYPPDADFIVLADTEGNKFRVIDTSPG